MDTSWRLFTASCRSLIPHRIDRHDCHDFREFRFFPSCPLQVAPRPAPRNPPYVRGERLARKTELEVGEILDRKQFPPITVLAQSRLRLAGRSCRCFPVR
jgi:hypothetical protein